MKTTLAYFVDTMTSEFTEIKTMMNDAISRGRGRWYENINNYRNELGLTWEQLREIDRNSLKKIVREYDNEQWRMGLEGKRLDMISAIGIVTALRYMQERDLMHYY